MRDDVNEVIEAVIPDTLDQEYPIPVVDAEGELQGEVSRENIAEVLISQRIDSENSESYKS